MFGVTGCGSADDVQVESRVKNAAPEASVVSDAPSAAPEASGASDASTQADCDLLDRLDQCAAASKSGADAPEGDDVDGG